MEQVSSSLSQFEEILASGRELTIEDLPLAKQVVAEYPFFTLPAAMMLKVGEVDDENRVELRQAVALNSPDMESLMKLIDIDGAKFASFYPEEPEQETPTTEVALDTFLEQYGTMDKREHDLLERLIFNPVPDYSQVLAMDETPVEVAPLSAQDALLDAFLANQDAAVKEEERLAQAPEEDRRPTVLPTDTDAPLSESLAKIYIGKGRYDKAYEIIYQLSLNFPKKSVYFADQLRFLKKLMYIQGVQEGKTNKK